MELKEIYSHLEKSIAQIHLHQRFMRKVVSEEVTELYKGKDALAADLEEDYMKSHNKMFLQIRLRGFSLLWSHGSRVR